MSDTGKLIEERLAYIEDRLAIYNLLATHPLSADTGSELFLRAIYTDDATFDRGKELHGALGIDKIVAFAASPAHREAMDGGLAHFGNLPLVEVHGDTATATSYIMIVTPDTEGTERELANHGSSQGYRIHRVVANRWEIVRRDGHWRIKTRTLLPLDGAPQARAIVTKAASFYERRGTAPAEVAAR